MDDSSSITSLKPCLPRVLSFIELPAVGTELACFEPLWVPRCRSIQSIDPKRALARPCWEWQLRARSGEQAALAELSSASRADPLYPEQQERKGTCNSGVIQKCPSICSNTEYVSLWWYKLGMHLTVSCFRIPPLGFICKCTSCNFDAQRTPTIGGLPQPAEKRLLLCSSLLPVFSCSPMCLWCIFLIVSLLFREPACTAGGSGLISFLHEKHTFLSGYLGSLG